MKLLPFYLCLLAIICQAISASSSLNANGASLNNKESGGSKAKRVVRKPVSKRKLPNISSKSPTRKNKRGRKSDKSKEVTAKESESKLLIELLPKELVTLVVDYFKDDLYPLTVSTHSWTLGAINGIAVDSARLYILTCSEGLKGLDHSLANIKDERRFIEFGDPQWLDYTQFSSSRDSQYVFFSYWYKASTEHGEQAEYGAKWLMQRDEPEDRRFKHITLDGEGLLYGLLSRDGQTLCFYNFKMNPITRVYRLREEAGKDPVGFMKFELDGIAQAVSGKGNRVIAVNTEKLEIHDVGKDASKLVCQIGMSFGYYTYALNEDGSEAAFASVDELRIMEVDKVSGSVMEQSAIVTVKVSESLGRIDQVMYSDGGKLHVLHGRDKVSLFDPSTNEFVLLEAPQKKGQNVLCSAISPNAD